MTATATAPVRAAESGGRSTLAGTGTLIRFILRRDRVRLPVWIGAIGLFTIGSVASLPDIYLDDADLAARADLMNNPGLRVVSGPGYGLDDYTFGAMIAHEYLSWIAVFVGLMSILLVVRHTRAEEETGRAELVRAGVVGRHASLTAAMIVIAGAHIVLGALVALGLGSLGLENVGQESSWLFGAALAAIGIVFVGVTAVTVQISEHGRGSGGLAGAALALAYFLRAAGDAGQDPSSTLSWLSPIGWSQQTRVYVDDRWWPLLLSVALTIVLAGIGYRLNARRDVGAGLIRSRPGAPTAPASLSSPVGLAWRLNRSATMWWSIALLLFGLGYGTIVSEAESFAEEFSAMEDLLDNFGGTSIIDTFLAMLISLMAVAVSVYAVLTVLRLRSEETGGRAEPVLATATSRMGWVASHVTVAMVGSAVILLLGVLGLGVTAAAALEDGSVLPRLLGAGLAYLPAIWLTVGLGVALFGVVPRATALVWILISYAALIGSFAAILDLPEWTLDLSPFGHVPALPAVDMAWTPVLVLTGIAVGLFAVGLWGFRLRDLETK